MGSSNKGTGGTTFAARQAAMFFKPTPSKFDKAKIAARSAASAAKEAAEHAAHSVAESAHSLFEQAPHIAAGVADAVSAKAAVVGESLSDARDSVAAKVEAVRHRGEATIAPDMAGSMASAQHKAEAARKAADLVNREAERAELEVQKKAETKIARIKREMADKRAEFEHEQALLAERAARLDAARLPFAPHTEEVRAQRPAPVQIEERVVVPAPPVEVPSPAPAPVVEHHKNEDDGFEYHVVAEKEGGSKLWLIIGGAVFVGAALIYFFKPGSGRRSRAAIKDRLAKVKDDAVDKVTGASDAAPQRETEAIRRAEELSLRADDKLAEVIEHLSTPTELAVAQPEKEIPEPVARAVETYEDAMPLPEEDLSHEMRVASADAVEGVAVEAYEPLGHIETAASAGSQLDEPHNPNIFDKVAGVVGHIAEAAENLAGEDKDKDSAGEKAAEIEVAAHEASEEAKNPGKKKKSK